MISMSTYKMLMMAVQGKDRWAARSLRSGFGNQVRSESPTSPGASFGSADRDGCKRVRAPACL